MKILQISSVPITYPGGTEKVIFELSKKLAEKNKVTILQTNLYEKGKKFKREEEIHKIKIITCKNDSFLGGYGYSKEFKERLRKIWKDYDIVHIHGYGRFTSDLTLKFLRNKRPMIFTAHGFFHSKKAALFKKIHNITKGRLLKNASYCTALTELEKSQYLKRGIKKERIKIIPNGVDLKRFNIKASPQLKRKYSNGKKILLYVGRIHESKGLQYVVKAIKDLDVKFLIVGVDAGYKKELKNLILKLDISKKVEFINKPDDKTLTKIFSISDIFILFSEWEGFGIVVIEAMASGKPVIVSGKGALPFLINDEKNGLVVDYPNINELRLKINELLKNSKKAEKIGKNGRKVARNYDWEKIVKTYKDLYKVAEENFNG